MSEFFLKAKVQEGELVILNKERVRDFFLAHEGEYYEISVKPIEHKISAGWHRWYRGIAIGTIKRELENQTGDIYSADHIHAYNISKITNPKITTRSVLGETIVETKKFSLEGITEKKWYWFKDKLLAFWASRGIIIDEPGDENFANDERRIDKIKNFTPSKD